MTEVRDEIVVECDVDTVYTQWVRFDGYPEFMQGVERVEPADARQLHWTTRSAGAERSWDAEIVEQKPYQVIAWRATGGSGRDGRIEFEPLGPARTRIEARFDWETDGSAGKGADARDKLEERVRGDLERFKRLIEARHGPGSGQTKAELYARARDLDIPGRSKMTKVELADAIERRAS